jgi:hypothetical protein
MGLRRSVILGELLIDFTEFLFALFRGHFLRVNAPDLDKLEVVIQSFFHYKALIKLNFDDGAASIAAPFL